MNNGLNVNAGGMSGDGKRTIQSSEEFGQELNNLKSKIEELLSMWHGEASMEFNKSYEVHNEKLKLFQELLNELGNKIVLGSKIFDETEEANAAAAGRLV